MYEVYDLYDFEKTIFENYELLIKTNRFIKHIPNNFYKVRFDAASSTGTTSWSASPATSWRILKQEAINLICNETYGYFHFHYYAGICFFEDDADALLFKLRFE